MEQSVQLDMTLEIKSSCYCGFYHHYYYYYYIHVELTALNANEPLLIVSGTCQGGSGDENRDENEAAVCRNGDSVNGRCCQHGGSNLVNLRRLEKNDDEGMQS